MNDQLSWHWIKACLQGALPPSLAVVSTAELVGLLMQHQISGFFYRWLQKYPDSLPAAQLQAELQPYIRTQQFKSLAHLKVVRKLLKIFAEAQIEVFLLKGAGLSQRLYGDTAVRQYGDIDLLIDRKNVVRAHEVFCKHSIEPELEAQLNTTKAQRLAVWRKDLPYRDSESGIGIELHWSLNLNQNLYPTDFKTLWAHRSTFQLNDIEINTLGDHDNFLFLGMHGAKHVWRRLQWIADVGTYVHVRQWDWAEMVERAKQRKTLIPFLLSMQLINEWMGIPLPDAVQREITLHKQVYRLTDCACHFIGIRSTSNYTNQPIKEFGFKVSLSPYLRYKLLHVHHMITAPYAKRFGSRFPPLLSFAVYLMEPWLSACRVLSRWSGFEAKQ